MATTKKIYTSAIPFSSYFLKNGKQVAFVGGEYATDNQLEIDELDAQVADGGADIMYAGEKEVATVSETVDAIKKAAIAEYLANQAAATDKNNDLGTSDNGKLNLANSNTVAEGAAGSDSGAPAPVVGAPTPAATAATPSSNK